MSKKKSYEHITYNLLQITLCTGLYAIHKDDEGKDAFTYPLAAVGVATETIEFKTDPLLEPFETLGDKNVVVGLDLSEGYFEICNEDSNFVGIFPSTDVRVQNLLRNTVSSVEA